MNKCPACGNTVGDHVGFCPFCGRRLANPNPPASFSVRRKEERGSRRFIVAVLLGLVGGLLVVGLYWHFRVSPRLERIAGGGEESAAPGESTEARMLTESGSDFDRVVPLTGDPLGLAWNGNEFLIGNRVKPWGFLRVRRSETGFQIQEIPVTESRYHQQVAFVSLAWNGKNYVGVADGAFFGNSHPLVFTIHNPQTLRIEKWVPAPNMIGGLTWDGEGYWAATRKNTEDAPEPAKVYKLDPNLNVVKEFDSPAAGCQGLAWDGSFLWFVDVFSDYIYVLDVSAGNVSVRTRYNATFSYLSGIAYDSRNMWITEYDNNRLRRLSPKLQAEWTGIERPAEEELEGIEIASVAEQAGSRSDSYENAPTYPSEDTEVIRFSASTESNSLLASWDIYFGEDLFSDNTGDQEGALSFPTFAKYRLTVRSDTLSAPIVKEYDAESGENIEEDVELLSSLESGDYDVELFIHVQYVDQDGTNQILNRSAPGLHVTSD